MIGRARRQHTVTQAYLQAWADETSRVLYVDKTARSAKLLHPKAVFTKRGFVTFETASGLSDELEQEFARIESLVIPKVKEFVVGADEAQHHNSVKALMALHFARSTSLKGVYERIGKETASKLAVDLSNDENFHQEFRRKFGRPASVGDINDVVWEQLELLRIPSCHFASRVHDTYNKALDWFKPMHVQRGAVATTARRSLIVADSPVMILKQELGTSAAPPALNDADFVWFPLGPEIGVSLTSTRQRPATLDHKLVVRMNQLVWDFADRYVVGDPRADLNRSLGYPTQKVTIPPSQSQKADFVRSRVGTPGRSSTHRSMAKR